MDPLILTPELLSLLFAVALCAGCLDTLVGGGGLLVLPALIMVGISPLQALGTNKLQGTMGTATASMMMLRHRKVVWREVRILMLTAFIGSACGSLAVQAMDTAFLEFMIPLVLIAVAAYFLLSGSMLKHQGAFTVPAPVFQNAVVPAIGLYDGVLGPGAGSFFSLAGVALRGQPLLQATATAKTLNFATNFASLLVFVSAGNFIWQAGLVMMAGQVIGAYAGSHILFKINPLYLRALIVVICLAMLARYFIAN
jgi:uncharacterized membrane protein YfcA